MFENMNLRLVFIVTAAVFFIVYPVYSFIGMGPFLWHVVQPEAWQGGLELVLLFLFFYYSITVRSSFKKYAFFLIPAILYSRRHGVDLSIISLYLYIEAIFSIGWTLSPYVGGRQEARQENYFFAGFLGVTVWLFIIWLLSAIGFGSIKAIQIITCTTFGLALLFNKAPRLVILFSPWLRVKRPFERASVALIGILFFALFAKISSAQTIDYDSMWYGLQLEKVMLGEGSLYSYQGLVAMVHYYPKLYESLLIPFSGLDSRSLLMGLGVYSWLLVILTSFAVMREFKVGLTLAILVSALIATLPALGNISITTKGDSFAAWLGILGVFFLLRFRKTGDIIWFLAGISASVFSILSRLSVLPYIAILIFYLIFSVVEKRDKKVSYKINKLNIYIFPILSILVATLIFGRSVYLAGVPFIAPNQLVNLENYFGMYVNYPVGTTPSSSYLRIPILWGAWSYLFNPANFVILLITWVGNVWIFLPIAGITLSPTWRDQFSRDKLLFLLIGLAFPIVLFTTKFNIKHGADGNYFILPIICLLIFGSFMLNGASRYINNWLGAVFLSFSMVSSAIIFVTGSWGPGTRSFDFIFNRLPFEISSTRKNVLNKNKFFDIYEYFKGVPTNSRVIGFEDSANKNDPIGWQLPVRYEPIEIIYWSRPELVNSSLSFRQFLIKTKINYILLSRRNSLISNNKDSSNNFIDAINELNGENLATKTFDNSDYEIWKLAVHFQSIRSHSIMKNKGIIDASLAPGTSCENYSNLQAKIRWSFPNILGIHIEVKSEASLSSKLWADVESEGEATTGAWVAKGTEFTFRNISDNSELAKLIVDDCASD